MKLWKRNAVVAAIVLFVCAAVYLNWSYTKDGMTPASTDTGKVLGEAALVGGGSSDPLLGQSGDNAEATGGDAVKPLSSSSYFASARINRQQARDSALSLLQQSAADEKADQVVVDDANKQIQALAANTLTEAQIEGLVTAKGYPECVAFLSDSSISIVVSKTENGLAETDTAKISEIVKEQTGLKASQIKIIEAS